MAELVLEVDLNADLAEIPAQWESGHDLALLDVVTSANVCSGAYAGDQALTAACVRAALDRDVAVGAHVGYPDRDGFGRREQSMTGPELQREVRCQILGVVETARAHGGRVTYVKPHGALYHRVAVDPIVADAVVAAIESVDPSMAHVGMLGTQSESATTRRGLRFVSEGFADRAYRTGGLVSRGEPDAVIEDVGRAAEQSLRLVRAGIRTICVHADNPSVLVIAAGVRRALVSSGKTVARFDR